MTYPPRLPSENAKVADHLKPQRVGVATTATTATICWIVDAYRRQSGDRWRQRLRCRGL